MKIYCISEGELHEYNCDSGKETAVTCNRVNEYFDTIRKMKQRDEWKTTGKGAQFMGVEEKRYAETTSNGEAMLRFCTVCGDRLIYSTFIDGVGGLYFKDKDDEQYIFANGESDINGISCRGGKCAVSCGQGMYESHIAAVDTENGYINQLTEGFTSEKHPFISRRDKDIIYYTAMGYARNQSGAVLEKSPCSICAYNEKTGELCELVQSDEYDYIKPQDDKDGNLYYIRRKYEPTKKKGNLGLDILLFPVRIIKAIGGFLSMFSMAFGGEPLRTGGNNPAKSRAADERKLFVEGNLINAEKQLSADSDGGIIPSGWVLIKRGTDGEEAVIKKGIMDYYITDGGDIICSDGSWVRLIHTDGKEEKLCKLKLANSISVME